MSDHGWINWAVRFKVKSFEFKSCGWDLCMVFFWRTLSFPNRTPSSASYIMWSLATYDVDQGLDLTVEDLAFLGQGLSVHVIIRLGMAPTIFSIKEIGRLRMDSGFSHHQKGRRGNYTFSSKNFRQAMHTIISKTHNPISRALHCTF